MISFLNPLCTSKVHLFLEIILRVIPAVHTVSSEDFRSLSATLYFDEKTFEIAMCTYSQNFSWKHNVQFKIFLFDIFLIFYFINVHLLKWLIAIYGAKMCESVFRIIFLILARVFESVETWDLSRVCQFNFSLLKQSRQCLKKNR